MDLPHLLELRAGQHGRESEVDIGAIEGPPSLLPHLNHEWTQRLAAAVGQRTRRPQAMSCFRDRWAELRQRVGSGRSGARLPAPDAVGHAKGCVAPAHSGSRVSDG